MLIQLHFWEDDIRADMEHKMTQPQESLKTHSGWLDYIERVRVCEMGRLRGNVSESACGRNIKAKEKQSGEGVMGTCH